MEIDPDESFSNDCCYVLTSRRFTAEPMKSALLTIPATFYAAPDLAHSNDQTLKSMPLETGQGTLTAAVKYFPPRTCMARLRDRRVGTRGERCWQAARHLQQHHIDTPTPLAIVQHLDTGGEWWVTEQLPVHRSFKDKLIRLFSNPSSSEEIIALLQDVADAIRRMHACGLFHGDLGNQNILLNEDSSRVYFIDLNRARVWPDLSLKLRARDLSRIHLPSDLRRIFYEMIFQSRAPQLFLKHDAACRRRYRLHSRSRKWRHPIRERRRQHERAAAEEYPDFRDIWIWDDKSMQAISTMRSRERHHYTPAGTGLQVLTSTLASAPAVWRQFKKISRQPFDSHVEMHHRTGLAVEPSPTRWPHECAFLEQLPIMPILIRFYHHRDEADLTYRANCVKELHAKGYPVAAALVQDRHAVTSPENWQRFCRSVLKQADGVFDWVEVGHAVNRVKWGCWTGPEAAELAAVIPSLKQQYPDTDFCGPAGIDFEYHRVLSVLRAYPENIQLDALSHHLYVDRRGAPETPQAGFSTWHKCALLKAVADTHDRTAGKILISEVNWPLKGTGIYSPVGSPYLYPGQQVGHPAVTEDQYAHYMIRYLLQTLCSGLVERVYWWNLAAHGFGLVDDKADPWRPRPAFTALQTWLQWTEQATFTAYTEELNCCRFMFDDKDKKPFSISYNPQDQGQLAPTYHREPRP